MAHDYVVVGAGSSGCVLAAGLASQGFSVLLLEAGPLDRDPRIRLPAAAVDLWFGPLDWAYETEPQTALDGRRDTWPRGRVLGGSSSVNTMMYIRGLPEDYDEWEAAGATGWNATSMLESFLRIEDDERGAAAHRGVGGPLRVERLRDPRPVSLAFLDACEELGVNRVDDYQADPDGCSLLMVNQHRGRRWSAVDAFLRPHLSDAGSSLRVRTGAEAVRVVVEHGRAVGVDVLVDGTPRFARADREVVLCAGAIATPHVLLRSGIGPADDLRALGVEVVVHAPEVGANLQDHLVSGVAAATPGGSLYGADREVARHLVTWLARRRGPLTSNFAEAFAFVRSDPAEELPDLELIAVAAPMRDHGRFRFPHHGLSVAVMPLRPRSRGVVKLASADPAVPPVVDPRPLTDEDGDDLRRMVAGVRLAQRLVTDTRALDGSSLVMPEKPLTEQAELEAHIRDTAQTFYHPVGTCRMGDDEDSVVDPELRVRGVEGLRVADASVMPNLIRGHTHAPALAIGERAARLVTHGLMPHGHAAPGAS